MRFTELMALVKGASRSGVVMPLVDLHLLDRNRPATEVEGYIHPSSLPPPDLVCPRALALEMYTPFEKVPLEELAVRHDAQTHRIFDNGTAAHRRYQALFIEMGVCHPEVRLGWEIPVESEKLRIRGHADAVIYPAAFQKNHIRIERGGLANGEVALTRPDGGFQYTGTWQPYGDPLLIEIKTMNDFMWSKAVEPLAHHLVQANLYAGLLAQSLYPGLKRIAFLYENKNDQLVKEFLKPADAACFREYARLAEAAALSPKLGLPKRVCHSEDEGVDRECGWHTLCFATKNYKELVQLNGTTGTQTKSGK
jgi:hypothetical protein